MEELMLGTNTSTSMTGFHKSSMFAESSKPFSSFYGISTFIEDFNATNLVFTDQFFISNLKTLSGFKQLPYNWNGNGAVPFETDLLKKSALIIMSLKHQPQIFPTARQSIQFEYQKKNGDYLEFEIFENKIIVYSEQAAQEKEYELNSMQEINDIVESFYAQ
jgi:hypothetical protein